jgi:hypothetical protein
MGNRGWKLAIAELSLAPASELPNHVLGAIHKNLALCYLRLGEAQAALTHLESASDYLPAVDEDMRQMTAMAQARPETFLDRNLGESHVADHDRPMWEAFGRRDTASDPAAPIRK